jgi:Guanylate kinase
VAGLSRRTRRSGSAARSHPQQRGRRGVGHGPVQRRQEGGHHGRFRESRILLPPETRHSPPIQVTWQGESLQLVLDGWPDGVVIDGFNIRGSCVSDRVRLLLQDHWDDVVFAETLSKFPAYERVVLRHPGFIRPVVLFGPIADLAREKLVKDFPDKFSSPRKSIRSLSFQFHSFFYVAESDGARDPAEAGAAAAASTGRSGIVRLSSIRELVEKGRHALLDITPSAVDKLNYAQFYPVVIFLRADSKHTVKELRAGLPK